MPPEYRVFFSPVQFCRKGHDMTIKEKFEQVCMDNNVSFSDDTELARLSISIPKNKMFSKTRSYWFYLSYMGIEKPNKTLKNIAYKKLIEIIQGGITDFNKNELGVNEYVVNNQFACYNCGGQTGFRKGKCIDCLLNDIPWNEGDKVRVKSINKVGEVLYLYYNGYTLVDTGDKIKGGALNNNSTYSNDDIEQI